MTAPKPRLRLLFLGLPALVPAIFALVYLQSSERKEAFNEDIGARLRMAQIVAAREADVFEDANRLLMTLAAFPAFGGSRRGDCEQILGSALRAHPGLVNITIANLDGTLFCSGRPVVPSVYEQRTSDAWFRSVQHGRGALIGPPQPSATTGRPIVAIARPILNESGSAVRVLTASVDLAPLSRLLGERGMPGNGSFTLVNGNGVVVARFPLRPEFIGRRFVDVVKAQRGDSVGANAPQFMFIDLRTGGDYDKGYQVAVETDRVSALSAADRVWRLYLALMVVVALLGGLATLALAQWWIIRPTQRLKRMADRIANGEPPGRSKIGPGLFGLRELGEAFDAMQAAVRSRQTERDRAIAELGTSENRYRMLFDRNPNPMWVYDLETLRFLEVNQVATDHYGYTRDEFLSMAITDIRPREDIPECVAAARSRFTVTRSAARQWRHRLRDGRIIDVEISTDTIEFEGRPAVLVSARDVSYRAAMERALRDAEERMRFALEAATVGVWEVNLKTNVATWSEVAEVMHGLIPGSFGGTYRAFIDCIYPDDREAAEREMERGQHTQTDANLEYRVVMPGGSIRQIRTMGRFVIDDFGVAVRGAGICLDVTEHRTIEAQLRQAQKLEAVGQLAGGVAHDFNNLLTVIGGNTDFALADLPPDSPARQDLLQIAEAVDKASRLTRQLLAFGRKQILKTEPVDLDAMVDRLIPMLDRLIEEDIALIHLPRGSHSTTIADSGLLEQALINLVVNARDAMPDGGVIRVTTGERELTPADVEGQKLEVPPGCYVVLSVADIGCGMSPEVLSRAFEPFFTTKEVGKGTGLGLSSVYGTVKQLGGQLVAESRLGAGTTITMYLPRAISAAPAVCPGAAPEPCLDGTATTVLLVEDQSDVRKLAQRVLVGAGYRVIEADCADAALDRSRSYEGDIHVILSDVIMPGGSIVHAIDAIRRDRPSIAVLLMSGYPDRDVRDRLEAHDVQLIVKPFSAQSLLAAVREARSQAADAHEQGEFALG